MPNDYAEYKLEFSPVQAVACIPSTTFKPAVGEKP
jgi:hypothetical protein